MEAGIKPGEFWDLCFEETLLAIQGYEDRVNVQWQQTRLLIFTIAATVTDPDKRGEVYDLFYLPGDPTPEERQAAVKKMIEESGVRQKEFNDQLRKELAEAKQNG